MGLPELDYARRVVVGRVIVNGSEMIYRHTEMVGGRIGRKKANVKLYVGCKTRMLDNRCSNDSGQDRKVKNMFIE